MLPPTPAAGAGGAFAAKVLQSGMRGGTERGTVGDRIRADGARRGLRAAFRVTPAFSAGRSARGTRLSLGQTAALHRHAAERTARPHLARDRLPQPGNPRPLPALTTDPRTPTAAGAAQDTRCNAGHPVAAA